MAGSASYIAIPPCVDAKVVGVVCIVMTTMVIIVASGFAGSFNAKFDETCYTSDSTSVAWSRLKLR